MLPPMRPVVLAARALRAQVPRVTRLEVAQNQVGFLETLATEANGVTLGLREMQEVAAPLLRSPIQIRRLILGDILVNQLSIIFKQERLAAIRPTQAT